MSKHCLSRLLNRLFAAVIFIAIIPGMLLTPIKPARAEPPPEVTAASAVLLDLTTGEFLFLKNPDKKKAPASITKILTALVALERGHLEDRITISANPPRAEGTRVYLVEGETVTLNDLLYGMLLNSGNDAALAIAEHYGGSKAGFAKLMNEKAKQLGANNSNFVNPSGLSEPGHYITARDMAIIARAAMQNKTLREIVATKTYPWYGQDWQTTLVNQNKLLWKYEGANGIKNGYTSEANFTLVVSATRQNQTLIAVLLDEPSSEQAEADAIKLLDYGFQTFQSYLLVKQGEIVATITLENGKKVELLARNDLAVITAANKDTAPTGYLQLVDYKRPVQANTSMGAMVFLLDGQEIDRVEVINRQPIPSQPLSLGDWWLRITLALVAVYLLVFTIKKLRRRNRYVKSYKYSFGGGLNERH